VAGCGTGVDVIPNPGKDEVLGILGPTGLD
jgi:hypothetical protein